tara:strand:+ start:2968 stop:3099 length:132 start_codon:yes stop_codon:yes gene_type:complete
MMPDLNWWIPYIITTGIVIAAMTFPIWFYLLYRYLNAKDKRDE